MATKLLLAKIANERSVGEAEGDGSAWRSGTMETRLSKGTLCIAVAIGLVALRATIECLVA